MARMKFYCDAERCIECNACVTACKNEHEVPWGVNRRRVVTIKDGEQGERSLSVGPPAQKVHLSILPRTPKASFCGYCGAPNGQA